MSVMMPVLILAASVVLAQTPPSGASGEDPERVLREIMALLEHGEARRDAADIERAARLVQERFSTDASAEAAYARARLTAAQSELARVTGSEGDADSELDRAIEYAEAAVSRKPEWALGYAALADTLGRKINLKGTFAGLRHGSRVSDALARAERLAPASVEVLLAVGRQRLHTPRLFGGSTDEAISAFRRAVAIDSARPLAHFWLARALEESGAAPDAAAEYRKALELEPGYVEARRRLERLEAARPPATRGRA